jgi:hypothetical protein
MTLVASIMTAMAVLHRLKHKNLGVAPSGVKIPGGLFPRGRGKSRPHHIAVAPV